MSKIILAIDALFIAAAANAQGYDPQCMSLCTNGNYNYTYCQMQCSRGSGPSISPHGAMGSLNDTLNGISQRKLQDAQTKQLEEQTKALQQQNARQAQPSQLKGTLDQINREVQETCGREDYKPLMLHTACNANDLSLEQLTDKSNLVETDRPLLSKYRAEIHAYVIRIAAALRSSGEPKAGDAALARERAESLGEKNALALYEGTINWGDFNKRRKEINDALREEITRIAQTR